MNTKFNIISIGGGEIQNRDTEIIDRYIIAQAKKKNPNVLFIPIASDNNHDYILSFVEYYGSFLKCNVDTLLLTPDIIQSIIENKINHADIVYFGGGNTEYLLKMIGLTNLIEIIKNHPEKIYTGLSAGAIFWGKYAHSDSFSSKEYFNTCFLKGVSIIDVALSPHLNTETNRLYEFIHYLKEYKIQKGIAIDDNCAIHFFGNDIVNIISGDQYSSAYNISIDKNGKVCIKNIYPLSSKNK
jgi:dipeptidase E